MPREFVAVAWKSPVAGDVRVAVRVTHAHPACGNGVAWRLEQRRAGLASVLGAGTVDLGKEAKPPVKVVKVEKGDVLVLAVDARDGNHVCDPDRDRLHPHGDHATRPRLGPGGGRGRQCPRRQHRTPDRHGNEGTWSFVRGASKVEVPPR